ncbi:Hypothetical protein FKW44_015162 [Caligus rogercresseyi]|uniref:Uncharacterized protein n=1 Tax=Caligus rogercresseyi TaxID=217165 RepID=A0A7T8H085_CALRO|nr:Hypothetical protein FKW44_015162 [Caligus rogercresseyi]
MAGSYILQMSGMRVRPSGPEPTLKNHVWCSGNSPQTPSAELLSVPDGFASRYERLIDLHFHPDSSDFE